MLLPTIPTSRAVSLQCFHCNREYDAGVIQTFATCCGQPLLVKYDLATALSKQALKGRALNMWRYAEMLPVSNPRHIVSLGEGMTPQLRMDKLAARNGFDNLWVKDESVNPTGSFKARGISVAVSKAQEFGIKNCIIPTAGNAGGALAAYCARAGIRCTVVMPAHTPAVFKDECRLYGADLVLVDGLIHDCARRIAELNRNGRYFDMSTLKEPYRLEGKKTMGYEIAEQLNWHLPDIIVYPAGGGTGLIGIWKAFKEMLALGWIEGPLPKMFAVQSENCAPLPQALKDRLGWKDHFTPSATIANGLAVPHPFGMDMMLEVLDQSGGTAIAVAEAGIRNAVREIAREEGMLVSPEGAATWTALVELRENGSIDGSENILLLNTGSGYKYLENFPAD